MTAPFAALFSEVDVIAMGRKMDWDRAKRKPPRVLSRNEGRLDRAADNWLDHGTLSGVRRPVAKKAAPRR